MDSEQDRNLGTANKAEARGHARFCRPTGIFGGLSGKLLILTIFFILLAEVLIFVPSVANMRLRWLEDRLNTAAAAATVIDGLQPVELPRALQKETLMATGTRAIVLRKDGTSRLLATAEMPASVDEQYDLSNVSLPTAMRDALDTLLFGGNRIIRVFGPVGGDAGTGIEVVLKDTRLRNAMLAYSGSVFLMSILISLFTATLIFFAINRMMIGPIRRLTDSMQAYSDDPEDPSRVLVPDEGRDELAVAGRHLASMQSQLQKTLKQQKNLAALGLAVSKINHDMRNILSAAQLMSDRLVDVDDPMVKRFAPKLLRTIDRAVGYTTEVLSYGQTSESAPRRRRVHLHELIDEVRDILAIDPDGGIEFVEQVSQDLVVDADSEQLFRVIHNLCRNAHQALVAFGDAEPDSIRRITVSGHRIGSVVGITVDDTGPGMPQKARENLFTAFRGSARSGGTGLGLAIARELVLAHGGTIALVEKPAAGTQFRIEIPDRPVSLDDYRSRSAHES
ncbi:HAMP domain-containing histidine kinase [Agrobacterium sp. SHOUNA12C]|uniref:histidine kinase n=1 Tax=Rhizobium rhizogenes (strain K84 / ATCC BAA-868) TaxID=311403 RepID=B9J8E9_RHIR8|nr:MULTISPECIES: HAMP domain-containing sensor histidine kinase [Rhizobium]ACM25336.1 two-component sensor histidine kinase protein [Rhizobium rhizogenes K84]MCJ9723942.1 HAMP domain-containing histidine kinase [Agrobacterium sp. BETTINA12B]MCJ9759152.1 HAMP domain-containing histidine kinase [Agrobacterium sp. SHOUNA12C]OCJ21685.1 histidine kinase [Agrobacterium sp. B131/95]OCJ26868.1 histidine kinase [Agrobacterium sp. B133/95]